jgi:hypothetical protein
MTDNITTWSELAAWIRQDRQRVARALVLVIVPLAVTAGCIVGLIALFHAMGW